MKKTSISLKLTLDLVMAVLFMVCMGFRLTVETTHEWAGIVLFTLLSLHAWFNWSWYRNLFKGKYTFRRVVNTVVNLCLVGLIVLLLIGGLMNAHLLKFLELKGGMQFREWHTFAAYWSLVLVGIHIGMHWSMITGTIRKWTGNTLGGPGIVLSLRLLGVALVVFGVWASFDREMGSKLFLGFGFDYWNPERPAALFYISTFSVMALYVFITHCALRLVKRISGWLTGTYRTTSGEASTGIQN